MHNKQDIKKVCSFCVSDLHLITMLLPYLNNKITSGEKFITIFEKSLVEQVKLVLSRLMLKEEDKKDLLNINWDSKHVNYIQEESEKIKDICNSYNKLNIIINGSKEYIEDVNQKLNQFLKENKLNSNIKIINCYDITKLDDDIKLILRTHDIILNTSGEKEISEVFEGYEKRKYA